MSPSRSTLLLLAALPLALPSLRAAGPDSPQAQVLAPVASASSLTRTLYLSGRGPDDAVQWDFFCTAGRRAGEWTSIKVPSCWEQEGFGTYNYGMSVRGKADDHPDLAREQGRYRTRFTLPADWRGSQIRLVFDGVMTDAEVWVNGQSAGPVHQGAFYRFRHDITSLLRHGQENVLEVLVSKESANRSVNEAERRGDYWNFGGIFRPVFLEALPSAHIDRIATNALADGSLTCDVFTGGTLPKDCELGFELTDSEGRLLARHEPGSFDVAAASTQLALKVSGIKPWSAETPVLYSLKVVLVHRGNVLHSLTERIGFRTFEVREGDGLYLNGSRITMKGVNRHAFRSDTARTLSAADDLADVRLIREMNMNAVRMSHYPPDKSFLDACDEQGLYVLNELGGWHGRYDTQVGRGLLREMIERDVNHTSILFWDNGNEMGWNAELDDDFAKLDPQKRPVLHPLGVWSGINTFHYRSYAETESYLKEPEIFLPTEFLHGLYDGGHGAGLYDYWELMRKAPRCAGGFLWVFADEGLRRTDRDNAIDPVKSFAPDGIVGPDHEKEGSFNTIKEVWSPIVLGPDALPPAFNGALQVENRYDFINLEQCSFEWSLVRFPAPEHQEAGHVAMHSGRLQGPSLAPHASGVLQLPLPDSWREADALLVTALSPRGEKLWTKSWSWSPVGFPTAPEKVSQVQARDDGVQFAARAGNVDIRWDKDSGNLDEILVDGRQITLRKGPKLMAAHRKDRSLQGDLITEGLVSGDNRLYVEDPAAVSKKKSITQRRDGNDVITEVTYDGALRKAVWRLVPDGTLYFDYEYELDGVYDLVGVWFDYPETRVQGIRWLGMGPWRVWQNRLHGTTLDVWANAYNDTIPGSTFGQPEFKGYFRGWHWATFDTTEGRISIENRSPGSYLGVYSPKPGAFDPKLCVLPQHGVGVFDVIPAMRNKVNATELVGPSSQPVRLKGLRKGSIAFRFTSK